MARKGRRQKLKSGAEYDIIGACRRYYCYLKRAGVKKAIRKAMRKRERQEAKRDIDGALED